MIEDLLSDENENRVPIQEKVRFKYPFSGREKKMITINMWMVKFSVYWKV